MRLFVPDIRISSELPPQTGPEDKLGGVPWGLEGQWPKCADCGKSMSLLAQFLHHPERLDLGRDGRMLHVFQCDHDPGMCRTWEGGSGANTCFVTEPEEMRGGISSFPADKPTVEREVRIVEWRVKEDAVPSADADAFFAEDAYREIPEDLLSKVTSSTRLGGVPYWIQSPDEAPGDGWHFVGQLDSGYSFVTPPKTHVEGVEVDQAAFEGRTHWAPGPNFGDGGVAYLFVRPGPSKPEGWFFWQCG